MISKKVSTARNGGRSLEVGSRRPIVVVPANGLGNRLRAIAGASYLAARHRRELLVLWESDSFLPDSPTSLFEPLPNLRFIDRSVAVVNGLVPAEPIRLYLDQNRDFLALRGYDKGEQRFIRELDKRMLRFPDLSVVIQAGDLFHPLARSTVTAGAKLLRMRKNLYASIFAADLRAQASKVIPTTPFIGISIRGTDLTNKVSKPEKLIQIGIEKAKSSGRTAVYVSSESGVLKSMAAKELTKAGLSVFLNARGTASVERERRSDRVPIAGREAVIDFIALTMSNHYVGPAGSTFVTEIAASRHSSSNTLVM